MIPILVLYWNNKCTRRQGIFSLSNIVDCASYVAWPAELFDAVRYSHLDSDSSLAASQSEYPKETWWIGQSGDYFVGLTCTRPTELEKKSGEHFQEAGPDGRRIELQVSGFLKVTL